MLEEGGGKETEDLVGGVIISMGTMGGISKVVANFWQLARE